ncbi:MAG: hypothetical protein NC489_12225 [Ruminococcus flavefaciens]|nr:hypothetical protein [Ruminococcus flavefaciens]
MSNQKATAIKIRSKDRTGLICEITKIFSDMNIGILNHSARVYNDRNKGMISECSLIVCPENEDITALAKRRLRKLKGVISVN